MSISFTEAIKTKRQMEAKVSLCEEVINYLSEIESGSEEDVLPRNYTKKEREECVSDLKKIIDNHRIVMLKELERLKKSEVHYGDSSSNGTTNRKGRTRSRKKSS
tara:strand:+ start:252 stop:566 length:315 start_codon:yes stop_codon:yes gene_type:complete